MQLENRSVAILGGSAGIGLATAPLLAERAAEVTIGGRDERRLADAASSRPGSARTIVVDATDSSSLRNFFSQAGLLDDLVVTVTSRNDRV
jgi:short-subunit dehydrogenase involved in D-alanine esterification of teichoic acids